VVEAALEIVNRLGLHARAAAKLVHAASGFVSDIAIDSEGESVDAKSMLGVLLLAAAQGMTITIRCEGEDEEAALAAMLELIGDGFGELE
jgi:phosphocarrier protein